MVIDSNLYWLPEQLFDDEEELSRFLAEIPQVYGTRGYETRTGAGVRQIVIEKPAGYPNLNYAQGDYRLEQQLRDLDAAQVDRAVLKLPGCHEWMSLETCRSFNTRMAGHARQSGGRLVPLAVVPPRADEGVRAELRRCREELGIRHLQMCAHYGDCYLDDPLFAPFFEMLNEHKTTVYIHHTPVPVEHRALYGYNNLRRSYGRCVDQTTAIGREVFSGFFRKYPNLTFVHSMLGGGFFAVAGLLFPHKARAQDKVQRFEAGQEDVEALYRGHVYFEMSHAQPWGKAQLECAARVLGADHILFGTSYPVRREWLLEGPAFVRSLDLTEEEKERILSRNAQRLYGIG